MHDSQLSRHSQYCTLARGVCQLRRRGAYKRDHRGRVDDRALGLLVASQGEDAMLAAEPDALYIDVVGEIPDFLRSINGVCKKLHQCLIKCNSFHMNEFHMEEGTISVTYLRRRRA
jgi:hypothetical protein